MRRVHTPSDLPGASTREVRTRSRARGELLLGRERLGAFHGSRENQIQGWPGRHAVALSGSSVVTPQLSLTRPPPAATLFVYPLQRADAQPHHPRRPRRPPVGRRAARPPLATPPPRPARRARRRRRPRHEPRAPRPPPLAR